MEPSIAFCYLVALYSTTSSPFTVSGLLEVSEWLAKCLKTTCWHLQKQAEKDNIQFAYEKLGHCFFSISPAMWYLTPQLYPLNKLPQGHILVKFCSFIGMHLISHTQQLVPRHSVYYSDKTFLDLHSLEMNGRTPKPSLFLVILT